MGRFDWQRKETYSFLGATFSALTLSILTGGPLTTAPLMGTRDAEADRAEGAVEADDAEDAVDEDGAHDAPEDDEAEAELADTTGACACSSSVSMPSPLPTDSGVDSRVDGAAAGMPVRFAL